MIIGKARYDSKEDADAILRQQTDMEADRANYEPVWQDIANYTDPGNATYGMKFTTPGQRNDERIFDSTAQMALNRFAATMSSVLIPRTQRYQKVKVSDPDLSEDSEVMRWCEEVTDRLFHFRESPRANFYGQMSDVFSSLGGPGTGVIYSEDAPGDGMRYRAVHLAESYIAENFSGIIDRFHRQFEWPARKIVEKWGEAAPQQVQACMESSPERKFTIIHHVSPNESRERWRLDYRGMPFKSVYVCKDLKETLGRGGYWTFPYHVSRYVTKAREVYGRSPSWEALADIKMTNQASKSMIKQAQLASDPAWLLHDDGILQALSIKPGALNMGGVNESGQQLVHPLQTGSNFQIAKEEMEQRRLSVRGAYLETLFQILIEKPNMTATEVLERAAEKGVFLAPIVGRQQSELLGPLTEREIDCLTRAGALPPRPKKLIGVDLRFEYESPATRAQRAQEAAGFARTIEALTPLAQVKPRVLKLFNEEKVGRGISEINGVPLDWLLSKEEMDAQDQAEIQAAQTQQLIAAAPVVSDAAKKIAETQAIEAGA